MNTAAAVAVPATLLFLLDPGPSDGATPEAGKRGVRGLECSRCRSRSVAREKIEGLVGAAAKTLLGLQQHRCLDCSHRFVATSRSAVR